MLYRTILLPPSGREPPDLRNLCSAAISKGVLEIRKTADGSIVLSIGAETPEDLAQLESALASAYPGVQFREGECRLPAKLPLDACLSVARLQRLHHYPLNVAPGKDYADLLMRHLASLKGREVFLQVLFGSADGWDNDGLVSFLFSRRDKLILQLKGYDDGGLLGEPKHFTPTPAQTSLLKRIEERTQEQPHHLRIRLVVWGPDPRAGERVTGAWLRQFSHIEGGNGLVWENVRPRKREQFLLAVREHQLEGLQGKKDRRLVSASELAHILPLPWKSMHPEIQYVDAPGHRPPPRMSQSAPDWLEIGELEGQKILLPEPWYHAMFLGQTRTGKSTLLLNAILQLLLKKPNARLVVLDPHGALIEAIKERLSLELACQTIEFDPSRLVFSENGVTRVAVPFNVLHVPNRALLDSAARTRAVELVIGDLMRTLKNVFGEDSVGSRVDYFLSKVSKGLLESEGTNLVDAYYILTDAVARRRFSRTLVSSTVRSFIENELPKIKYEDLISSVNKVGKVTENDILRVALCQRANPINFSDLLRHRLILVNLSKSRIGTEASRFLGASVLTQLWLNLLQTGSEDKPVYLVADEFQNFASESFRDMLSESAKYGLHLVLANQYLAQIPRELRSAIIGNVHTWVFFRMGVEDAELAHEISRAHRADFQPDDFSALDNHRVVATFGNRFTTCSTFPPPPAANTRTLVEDLIVRKTREYATEETSMASPFTLDESHMGKVLEVLARGHATLPELQQILPLDGSETFQTVRRCQQLGYSTWQAKSGLNDITPLGRDFLASYQGRRVTNTEGELHTELLAKFIAYVKATWGVTIRVVPQGSSERPLADGEFEWEGVAYSVEVECTTITTKASQVVKNLRKALEGGRRVVFVVPTQLLARKLIDILEREAPEARVDRDFLVMYENGDFLRFPADRSPPFLPHQEGLAGRSDKQGNPPEPGPADAEATLPPPPPRSDQVVARQAVDALLARNVEEAEGEEIVAALPMEEQGRFRESDGSLREIALGKALKPLGLRSERVWKSDRGKRVRVYYLRPKRTPTASHAKPAEEASSQV